MNTLTDSLNLVSPEEKTRTFNLFKRRCAEKYGFALVVFRKQNLLGLIPSSDISVENDIHHRYDRLGVKEGDTIFSINLGLQHLKISETLPTKDNWPRLFQLELDIVVTNPIQFAQRYIQQSDPVAWAKSAIEGHIQSTAGLWDHDEITESMVRTWAQEALSLPKNTISGLSVIAVQNAFLPINPDRNREVDLKRALDQFEIETEDATQPFKKQEQINREPRNEQSQQDLAPLLSEEQSKEREPEPLRAEENKQPTLNNGRQLLEVDKQTKRQLKNFFLHTQELDKVSPVAEPSPSQVSVTAQARPVFAGVIQQTEETIEIPDLGLHVIQTILSKQQVLFANLGDVGIGYIVYRLNPDGPAQLANLQVADIIIDINNEAITNIQAISQAISKKDSSTLLTLHALRGSDPNLQEIKIKPLSRTY